MTNNIEGFFTDDPLLRDLRGGLLAMPISAQSNSHVAWIRKPLIEEVNWAGDPEKPLEETVGGYRLTPRGSFALWKKTVANKAEPWSDEDIETSRDVVGILLESQTITAERASVAKSEFLATMSHEIRTPLNAVVGLAHILSTSSPLSDRQRTCIQTLQVSADALLSLINDLLDISKIEARTIEFEAIPFDLGHLVQEVISMTSVRICEKNLQFNADIAALDSRHFIGDPVRLRQILLNLCSNAVKFTHQGGVTLSISEGAPAADGSVPLRFAVQDSGIGIAADRLDTIFHKFVQADNSIARQYGGTGLGLAITKLLVDLMGGTIEVESQPGKGSTFTVTLPLRRSEAVQTPPTSLRESAPDPRTDAACVLLVEDYAPNVLVATAFLEHYGYRWEVASNGVEAVEIARRGGFMAILMDVQMHGMNGFDATKMIRAYEKAAPGQPHVPIIGITAHALAGDRERCIASGMDDYMSKPFDPNELEQKLAAYAEKSRSSSQQVSS